MQKSRPDGDKMKVCFLYKALNFQVIIIKKTAKGGFATSGCGFGMYEVW